MNYTVLVRIDEQDPFDLSAFDEDERCVQIVAVGTDEQIVRRAAHPRGKTVYVVAKGNAHENLLNGLKAVTQENTIVCRNRQTDRASIDRLLEALSQYPAIDGGACRAFDTRLLMFCLQSAMEKHEKFENYGDVVALYDTPMQPISG
ncbi:hypothetical protein [Catenisphaera adipataccumulans]|jgi:hypothetical protein|uniref:L-asparaginase/Glu-tRNA(Gln) amidotransferase subunit D n=1 Tax=Catenisphaera adipataccumulans TaxID=700500 RepID=A0A7W8CYX6_9FIRM|nr:hypothetical protein [Catenisphaera adipataccumulans]MBB5182525.1 L-asparaginase/Glu-tRNA(Gln) amidotransferase subunit D [Catenisphaera adipataccumulans]